MGRPKKHDLSALQADITRLYGSEDKTREDIVKWLSERDPPVICSLQTLSRQLRQWGVNKGLTAPLTEEQQQVAITFVKENWLNDVETAEILSERLQTPISRWQIERLRYQHNLKMRRNNPAEREDPEGDEEKARREQARMRLDRQGHGQRRRRPQEQSHTPTEEVDGGAYMEVDDPVLDPQLEYRPAAPWPATKPFSAPPPSTTQLPTTTSSAPTSVPIPSTLTAPATPAPPPLPSTIPLQRPPQFSFHPTHPSSPSHYGRDQTALILIDFQPLVLNSLPFNSLSTDTPALEIAANLRNWALSHGVLTIHSLLNLNPNPDTRPMETSRLASRWSKLVTLARDDPTLTAVAPTLTTPSSATHHAPHSHHYASLPHPNLEHHHPRPPTALSALSTPATLTLLTSTQPQIRSLLLAGLPTSTTLLSTARHAADLGFVTTVVADACADPNPLVHDTLIKEVLFVTSHVAQCDTVMGSLGRTWRGERVDELTKRREKEERARKRKGEERRKRLVRLSMRGRG